MCFFFVSRLFACQASPHIEYSISMRPFFENTSVYMQGVNQIKAKEKQRKEIRAARDIFFLIFVESRA